MLRTRLDRLERVVPPPRDRPWPVLEYDAASPPTPGQVEHFRRMQGTDAVVLLPHNNRPSYGDD